MEIASKWWWWERFGIGGWENNVQRKKRNGDGNGFGPQRRSFSKSEGLSRAQGLPRPSLWNRGREHLVPFAVRWWTQQRGWVPLLCLGDLRAKGEHRLFLHFQVSLVLLLRLDLVSFFFFSFLVKCFDLMADNLTGNQVVFDKRNFFSIRETWCNLFGFL